MSGLETTERALALAQRELHETIAELRATITAHSEIAFLSDAERNPIDPVARVRAVTRRLRALREAFVSSGDQELLLIALTLVAEAGVDEK